MDGEWEVKVGIAVVQDENRKQKNGDISLVALMGPNDYRA